MMVCPSYPPQDITCGIGDYTRFLTEELAAQGHEMVVVCSTQYRGSPSGSARVLPLFSRWSIREAWHLSGSPSAPRADIVHIQYTPALYGQRMGFALLPLLARLRRGGPPVVVTFHTLVGGPAWSKVSALLLLATAHHCISANEEVTAMVRRRFPRLMRRLTEIPIGANIPPIATNGKDREAGRSLIGVPLVSHLLVHFGLVYPGKGLETLLEALALLRRQHPGPYLVVVGDTRPEDGDYRTSLETLAARLGVASAVIWAGHRSAEEVSRVLRSADVFVVPYDGGSSIRRSSLIVGLAHGLPVVSTSANLCSAYLKDGENVALVPPGNPQALAARIASLLAAPGEAARLGRAALGLAERFTWPTIARETRGLYARVLGR